MLYNYQELTARVSDHGIPKPRTNLVVFETQSKLETQKGIGTKKSSDLTSV